MEKKREREKHPVDNQKLSPPSPVGKKGPRRGSVSREGGFYTTNLLVTRWKQTNERERERVKQAETFLECETRRKTRSTTICLVKRKTKIPRRIQE